MKTKDNKEVSIGETVYGTWGGTVVRQVLSESMNSENWYGDVAEAWWDLVEQIDEQIKSLEAARKRHMEEIMKLSRLKNQC